MDDPDEEQSRHFMRVAQAIDFLRANARNQPTLEDVAAAVHLSPFHLQRLFTAWAGISPKRFLQYLTKEYAKQRLALATATLTVAEDAGLSSPSRLHDLMVSCEAMTPGEIKSAGRGLEIAYGFAPSPFGEVLAGWTSRGVCHFAFRMTDRDSLFRELATLWPYATFTRDDEGARALLRRIFPRTPTRGTVHLILKGTNFQIKVWEALIHTASGQLISYSQLARRSGVPKAQRAVGSALAANTLAFLIPCHRVLREGGESGNYRWGASRKLVMRGWEAARSAEQEGGQGESQ